MQMLAQLNASVRLVALAGLRSRYPNANDTELRRRLADVLLGEELARKVYGEISHANPNWNGVAWVAKRPNVNGATSLACSKPGQASLN
jgi:hypothetical protein